MSVKLLLSRLQNFKYTMDSTLQDKPVFYKTSGICSICGKKFKKLSIDHIPPRSCGNTDSVQIATYYGNTFINRNDGNSFITLCSGCNAFLGEKYDVVLANFSQKVKDYLECSSYLPDPYYIKTNPLRLAKAVIGHFLATIVDDNLLQSSIIKPLQSFVLNENQMSVGNVRIFYWLFPYKDKIIIRNGISTFNPLGGPVAFCGNTFHVLKFYPLAFAIVHVEETFFAAVDELTQYICDSEDRFVKISCRGKQYSFDLPESLQNDEVMIIPNNATSVKSIR